MTFYSPDTGRPVGAEELFKLYEERDRLRSELSGAKDELGQTSLKLRGCEEANKLLHEDKKALQLANRDLQHWFDDARDEAEKLRGRVADLETDRSKLPYDVVINGGMTFRKGVAIKTFVKAAERWHRQAMDQYKGLDLQAIRNQADAIEKGERNE